MNISPILLLAIGSSFALLYGLTITVGWSITRKNRKIYQNASGYSNVELFDLNNHCSLGKYIKTISLTNNHFIAGDNDKINLKAYNCYIVESESSEYPSIKKGDLILIDPFSSKIKYAFKIPQIKDFR